MPYFEYWDIRECREKHQNALSTVLQIHDNMVSWAENLIVSIYIILNSIIYIYENNSMVGSR
jgi:hypothetical protein